MEVSLPHLPERLLQVCQWKLTCHLKVVERPDVLNERKVLRLREQKKPAPLLQLRVLNRGREDFHAEDVPAWNWKGLPWVPPTPHFNLLLDLPAHDLDLLLRICGLGRAHKVRRKLGFEVRLFLKCVCE